jgi:hypothetical protein
MLYKYIHAQDNTLKSDQFIKIIILVESLNILNTSSLSDLLMCIYLSTCLLLWCLFNDALSKLDYSASKDKIIRE